MFVALELPDPVKEFAAREIALLKKSGADVKWVRPEALHMTLKFLGEVEPERAAGLGRAVERACADRAALKLHLKGAGAFPSPQRPRVIWLGLAGQLTLLTELAEAVDLEMGDLGFPLEERPFQAHLTLGRLREARGRGRKSAPQAPAGPLTRALVDRAHLTGEPFTAQRVVLMRSTLTPAGAVYAPVAECELAPAGAGE
ncbi:MAG: RNA 2',3'-cyclic phosphodiesterase [Deltaproteobacteria bacterium]|nr:RNA 2',3'-cyclic phosphodiesterase [Deltaproteobacteria bacterium]